MLRLTRLSDYGILLMSQMAMAAELRHTVGDLTAAMCVPSPMVSKVLKMLLQAGRLRFGIPHRTDGRVRMALQFAREFPALRNTLWSMEQVQ